MQTNTSLHQWRDIIRFSEAIMVSAQEERWEELPEKAQQRDKLIRAYFSQPITVENALKIHDEITQILALDEKILGLARKQQENSQLLLKTLRTNSTAIKAYQQLDKSA
jgi:hypothetical protein